MESKQKKAADHESHRDSGPTILLPLEILKDYQTQKADCNVTPLKQMTRLSVKSGAQQSGAQQSGAQPTFSILEEDRDQLHPSI